MEQLTLLLILAIVNRYDQNLQIFHFWQALYNVSNLLLQI